MFIFVVGGDGESDQLIANTGSKLDRIVWIVAGNQTSEIFCIGGDSE